MFSSMFFFPSSSNCRFSSGNKETRKVFYEKGIYLRYDVHHASFHQNVRPEIDPVLHRYLQVILLIRSHSIKKNTYVLLVRFVYILNIPSHYTTNIQDIGHSAIISNLSNPLGNDNSCKFMNMVHMTLHVHPPVCWYNNLFCIFFF
jgi:hypothetical protein